ncbi:hypothetical protein VTL71DRAFT_15446 [Oculimacula yallundae]|uniref:Secreted protein n=1 Tax=Oculimacula yallundae TaxID=86028 RepID=A0ABR4CGL9_9HELO
MYLLQLLPFAFLFFGQSLGQYQGEYSGKAPSALRIHCGGVPAGVKIRNNCAAAVQPWCGGQQCVEQCKTEQGAKGSVAGYIYHSLDLLGFGSYANN